MITEYKHLRGGKVVASKELLNLAGRGVIRETPKKLKQKNAIKKIVSSVLNQGN